MCLIPKGYVNTELLPSSVREPDCSQCSLLLWMGFPHVLSPHIPGLNATSEVGIAGWVPSSFDSSAI